MTVLTNQTDEIDQTDHRKLYKKHIKHNV